MAIANGKKASANGATTKKKATGGRIAGLIAGEPERVSIPPTKIGKFALRLIGQSPLICHAWDAKSIKMIEDSEGGKPKEKKAPKDPWAEFCGSLYWLTERPDKPTEKDIAKAKFGMPGNSFKLSAVNACRYVDGISMTFAYGAFHVIGQFVEIEGPPPRMRQDTVRVGKFGSKSATMRYRGEFTDWSVTLTIHHNENAITREQIVHLFSAAGFSVGVGEWRPEKKGSNGCFSVG